MSYTFVGDVYDRTTPLEMTQVNPEPVLPAKPGEGLQVPEIEDLSHLSLHQAARDGKLDLIKQKLHKFGRHDARRKKAINKGDEYDIAPLHYAVRYGHVDVVKLLVECGAEVERPGEDGASPLHYAARFRASATRPITGRQMSQVISDGVDGEVSSVATPLAHALSQSADSFFGPTGLKVSTEDSESLITYLVHNHAADVNIRDHYGMTPLHYAASKANLTAVKELLQCEEIKIDAVDASGSTALHCAATDGSSEIVKTLLEAGADVRAKDNERMTTLHFACTDGNIETVKTIFEHVESKVQDVSNMLEERNRDGETALHAAVEGGYLDIVQFCLEKGANVKARRANLAHPLHIAAINGHTEIAKCLVEHHAKIEARNVSHETPLHKAAAFNQPRMVSFLLEKRADIECVDKDNYTPLLLAASEGHTYVVQLLLEKGADLKKKDTQDKTAIFVAAEENCVDTLKAILGNEDAKLLINESDLYENSPLHVAAEKGYASIVETLLNHGARIDGRNEDENTPLHLAARNGRVRCVKELLKRDPSILNDEDEASNTALHLAATEGHVKCCKELLERGAEVDARNSTLWTPLDCAAAKGHLKVASLLLEFDSPVDPIDKTKTTPLHLAAREGHPEVVSLLLSKGADITLTDHTGRNCLDLAIDNGRKESAVTIINNENWMKVMRNKTWEQHHVTTPMRKLITKLPEVAEVVFNHCIKDNGFGLEDENYEISLYYEFLEDVYCDWSDSGDGTASETSSQASFSMEEIPEEETYQRLRGKSATDEAKRQLEEKKNHPLMIMVKNKREQLLGHPLVTLLLHYKWQTFGRYIYYTKLALYCIFLFFLTGYTVYSTENAPKCNGTTALSNDVDENSAAFIFWISIGRIIILVLASWHILSELFQMIYQFRQYSLWENLLEWAVFVLAIVYVADEFDIPLVNRCTTDKQTVGALSIFLAWMALVLFIRKFPKLGIYVVMFTSILKTFMKFFMIFVLFLVAFALAFYTLLKKQQPAFSEPSRSIVKTGVMMIGEFDFDDIFNADQTVPGVTWFIFIVFLIIMTLILMNLLIGLAVDDIKGVQEQAALERQAMLVDLAMDVEKALPRKIRKKFVPEKQVIRPNQYTGLKRYLYSEPVTAQDIQTALKPNRSALEKLNDRTEELQESVLSVRNRLKTLQCNQEELHKMLVGIVKKLEAIVEGDDDEDDQLF